MYNKTVNNVGVSHEFPTDFVDTSTEELATIINVNVTATLRITSLIAPSMASRSVPLPFSLPYTGRRDAYADTWYPLARRA